MPGRSPGEGYLSIMRCLPPLPRAFPSSAPNDPGPTRQTVHSDRKKQKVVLGTELVAQLERDRSRSVRFSVTMELVVSFAVSLPAKLRARRLKLQQERLRLDGKMTKCDWKQSMSNPFKKRPGNFKSGWAKLVCAIIFTPVRGYLSIWTGDQQVADQR